RRPGREECSRNVAIFSATNVGIGSNCDFPDSLAGASLLLRSLWNLENVHLGMQTENILVENVPLVQYRYATPEKKVAFFAELESRINRLPGMMAVALSDSLPPFGRMRSTIFAAIEVAGRPLFNEGSG